MWINEDPAAPDRVEFKEIAMRPDKIALSAAALLLSMTLPHLARSAPPPGSSGRFHQWFESLTQPGTGVSCCSWADCRETSWRIRGDHYEAFVDHKWMVVPDGVILQRTDNPTGRAVVCWAPNLGILCFVPTAEA